eukprot:TRINITY_DN24604_c0_g1_i2.p1 TRINITY_DN24604_c0_g1~~TRINITY_DN24604_c0_g1_i2.p1  ORF type:complete len:422 (+),score=84.43 TRINITY_DN24604_c0_g1_i2:375-1640(+)
MGDFNSVPHSQLSMLDIGGSHSFDMSIDPSNPSHHSLEDLVNLPDGDFMPQENPSQANGSNGEDGASMPPPPPGNASKRRRVSAARNRVVIDKSTHMDGATIRESLMVRYHVLYPLRAGQAPGGMRPDHDTDDDDEADRVATYRDFKVAMFATELPPMIAEFLEKNSFPSQITQARKKRPGAKVDSPVPSQLSQEHLLLSPTGEKDDLFYSSPEMLRNAQIEAQMLIPSPRGSDASGRLSTGKSRLSGAQLERFSLSGLSGRTSIGGAFSNSMGRESFGDFGQDHQESPIEALDLDLDTVRLGSNPDSVPLTQHELEFMQVSQDPSRGKVRTESGGYALDPDSDATAQLIQFLAEEIPEVDRLVGKSLQELVADRPVTKHHMARTFAQCLILKHNEIIDMRQEDPYGALQICPSAMIYSFA